MAEVELRKDALEMRYYEDTMNADGLSVMAFLPECPLEGRILFNAELEGKVDSMWLPNRSDPFLQVTYKDVIIGRGNSAEKKSWEDFECQLRAGETPRVEAISTDRMVVVSNTLINDVKEERPGWERTKELIESL